MTIPLELVLEQRNNGKNGLKKKWYVLQKEFKMRARIVDDLMETIDTFFEGKEGHRTDPEFNRLCNRISGREVDLVFIGSDAFEAIDNNYWLPDCCWEKV